MTVPGAAAAAAPCAAPPADGAVPLLDKSQPAAAPPLAVVEQAVPGTFCADLWASTTDIFRCARRLEGWLAA